jgi:hypothetical protein
MLIRVAHYLVLAEKTSCYAILAMAGNTAYSLTFNTALHYNVRGFFHRSAKFDGKTWHGMEERWCMGSLVQTVLSYDDAYLVFT